MNSRKASRLHAGRLQAIALTFCAGLVFSGAVCAQSSIGEDVCQIITTLLPEVRTYQPEGARAQLVMAVADKFDYDAATLRQVIAEVDSATTASCPKEREALLDILKMETLAEALS